MIQIGHMLTCGVNTPVDRKPSISHCCFLRLGRGAVLYNRPTSALSLAWWKFRGHNASMEEEESRHAFFAMSCLEDKGAKWLANHVGGEHVNLP